MALACFNCGSTTNNKTNKSSCITQGSIICTNCNTILQYLPLADHQGVTSTDYGSGQEESPHCTEWRDSYRTVREIRRCSYCYTTEEVDSGTEYDYDSVAPIGHSGGNGSYTYTDGVAILEPTCSADGQQSRTQNSSRTCSRCSTKETGTATTEYRIIPATGAHEFIYTSTIAPTTSSGGYDIYTCTSCNITESRNYINPIIALSSPYFVKISGRWITALPCLKTNGQGIALSRCYVKDNGTGGIPKESPAGTGVFNDKIDLDLGSTLPSQCYLSFVFKQSLINRTGTAIRFSDTLSYVVNTSSTTVYQNNKGKSSSFKTIKITSDIVTAANGTDVTSEFLIWLKANAVKQQEE